MLKEHLRGNPEISLQYFSRRGDGGQKNHQYAPILLHSECSRAELDLTWAQQVTICQRSGCASPPASKCSPSPSQGCKTSAQKSSSPFQAIPTPSTSSRTFGSSLATGDILEGTEFGEGNGKLEQLVTPICTCFASQLLAFRVFPSLLPLHCWVRSQPWTVQCSALFKQPSLVSLICLLHSSSAYYLDKAMY